MAIHPTSIPFHLMRKIFSSLAVAALVLSSAACADIFAPEPTFIEIVEYATPSGSYCSVGLSVENVSTEVVTLDDIGFSTGVTGRVEYTAAQFWKGQQVLQPGQLVQSIRFPLWTRSTTGTLNWSSETSSGSKMVTMGC